MGKKEQTMNDKLLTEVNDSIKLFLYEEILKQNDIPYVVKRPGIRGYMSILGGAAHAVPAEIYVSESDFDRAVNLTAVVEDEEPENPMEKGTKAYNRKRLFAWIIIGMFLIPLLALAIKELITK